jgi:hypothetical protein
MLPAKDTNSWSVGYPLAKATVSARRTRNDPAVKMVAQEIAGMSF